jgi:DNA-binding MarR family transcriptional regulator
LKSWSIQFSLLEAVTNRIDRLEQDGIVTRLRDPGDRRGVIVQLTDKGLQLSDQVMPVLSEKEQALLSQFAPVQECETLVRLLRQFLLSLERSLNG